ncbi:MAG: anthranilate phosphoribosyltransferase [Gemmatales bacterium]|nr:MAG: anthranilate phosphoribosyltransferase [Gemmatales bacterium]
MENGTPMANPLNDALRQLVEKRDLSEEQMRRAMEPIIRGDADEAVTAAFLAALRMKGETPTEVAAAASLLREHMIRLPTPDDETLDTCGTGGDGAETFNISTATAFVVAGAGIPVVKNGNRAVSSRSGSADVLSELGVSIDGGPDHARRCLEACNLAFCFAPAYHPALKHVAALRRKLGFRTIFNCLGPLVNPACCPYQLLGVGRREWLDLMAGALATFGVRHALLVHGSDGLDEISLSAPTFVREVRGNDIRSLQWTPESFGLRPCSLADLHVDGPQESAAMIRRVLNGDDCPATEIVKANAAAAILAAGRADNLRQGVELARKSIESGAARKTLETLTRISS